MILEILDDRGEPITIRASRVVARDSRTNTPLAVAVEVRGQNGDCMHMAATASDDDFNRVLRSLHVRDTVVIDQLDPSQLAVTRM